MYKLRVWGQINKCSFTCLVYREPIYDTNLCVGLPLFKHLGLKLVDMVVMINKP